MASSMGATAFQKGLGVNHAIAHALGVYYDLHHGLANATLLIGTTKYNIQDENARAKLALLGSVLGVKNDADEIVAMGVPAAAALAELEPIPLPGGIPFSI